MRLPIAAALLTLVACARTTEGPTPTVSGATNPRQPGVQPARVCNAQGGAAGWRVELAGSGFAPMPQDVLTDTPKVGLPEVTLRGPTTATLARERVFFVSSSQLNLDVPTSNTTPPQELPAGSYTVEVKNPSGTTGQQADALLVVPPPTLTSATAPNGFSQTAPSQVVLQGTGFRTGETPTVVLRSTGLPEVTLTDVSVVSPTEVTANVPADTAAGTYDVVVTNPEGCAFTLLQGLTINYASLGALTLDPRFGWQRQNQAVTLFNAPTGDQQTFSGGAPEIFLVAPLKTNPTQPVDIPLRRAAYVNANTVTAVVPTCSGASALPLTDPECPNGIVVGGPYALRVKDPSGAIGNVPADNGFLVLENPPPSITTIAPGAITTNGLTATSPLVVTGTSFGANAKVQLLTQLADGRVRACDLPATGTPSETELSATVPTSIPQASCVEYTATGTQEPATGGFSLTAGLYVVRVQNTENPAFANYSGLIVTNPAGNPLHGPDLNTRLSTPRANFPLVVATDDLGQPFLYALGGAQGRDFANDTLASVEVAQVTLFGDLGGVCTDAACTTRTFRTLERTPLPEPLRGTTAVARTVPGDTSYLFVMGGVRPDGTAVNTVRRAQVLKVADAPALLPPERVAGGTLPEGTFYYRVSAGRAATDASNPGGETLPSDEYPVTVRAEGGASVQLTWQCQPGAASYRVYRTVEPNAPAGTGLLLATVPAAACAGDPLPNVTYTDDGSVVPAGEAPLPPGSLGAWADVGTLSVSRGNAAARLVGDTVFVSGGFCSTATSPTCPADNQTLASVERATFVPDATTAPTANLGAFEASGTLTQARQRHSLAVANAATAPNSFTTTGATPNTQDVWLLALGGDTGTALVNTGVIEVGQVVNDGALVPAPTYTPAYTNPPSTHGGWATVVANLLLYAGATGGTGYTFVSDFACPGSGNTIGQCTAPTSFAGNLNATGADALYREGGPRYLSGNTLFRAFIYGAGGFPSDTGTAAPLSSIERIIY